MKNIFVTFFLKYLFRSLICLTVLTTASCANYAPVLSANYKPTAKDAFFYGRFEMKAKDVTLGMAGYMSMGFSIRCDDGEKYTIGFNKKQPLLAVKFTPSTCSLTEIVYSDADGVVKSRKSVPKGMMSNQKFVANKAYYLGDFRAEATHDISASGHTAYFNWRIVGVADEYKKTTLDLKEHYPNLVSLQTEDRMIGKK